MIEIRELQKRFGNREVLRKVSLEIRAGEVLFVLGKSGVGKSVLLKTIVGLIKPEGGEIFISGSEITHLQERELTPFRRKCGMVFQFPALLDSLTVYENIAFGLLSHQVVSSLQEARSIVEEKMRLVHLPMSVLEKLPQSLSFGMQKRVSIARALALEPEFLLFDEPTTGLDPVTTTSINTLIEDLVLKTGVGAVVVSHDLHSAFSIASRILLLEDGYKVFEGTSEEFRCSEVELARQFMTEWGRYAE